MKNYETVSDRVFTQEETKLFEVKGVLEFTDNKNRPIRFTNPVPVKDTEDGKAIGFVTVEYNANRLIASGTIDYSTEERLLIETGEKMYFSMTLAYGDDGLSLDCLTLTSKRPNDTRIAPVGSILL